MYEDIAKPDRTMVVERHEGSLRIMATCVDVISARRAMKILPHGTYSIVSFNELDVPVGPPKRQAIASVGKGQTFGKARGKRSGTAVRVTKAKKA
jgi:hypothetical protein